MRKQGFTFVEAMLAVVLLAVGMTGVLRAFVVVMNAGEVERTAVSAMALLNQKTAELDQAALFRDGWPDWVSRRVTRGIDYNSSVWTMETTIASKAYWDEVALTVFNERLNPARRFNRVVYVAKRE